MPIGIDPKVDFAFKLVFGSPEHTAVTIHFLNAVLQQAEPVTSVQILNPIQGQDRSEDKLVILDILAEDVRGRKFNIEMQTSLPIDLAQRLTFYNCLNLTRQIGLGEAYYQMQQAVSICVLNRNLFPQVPDYHLSFRLRCDQHPFVFTDVLEFHTLELPKFNAASQYPSEMSPIEKWLYFLRNAERMEASELARQLVEPEFTEAIGVLEMISRSPEERDFYEARQKFLHDEQARLMAARIEGREEGREEGRVLTLIDTIQMLEDLLGEKPTDSSSLNSESPESLLRRVTGLQQRLRDRQA